MPDAEALTELGYIYEGSGDADQAVLLYQQALGADPTCVAASVNLAKHLAQRERFSEAIRLWENALSHNPGLVAPGINLSQVYLQNGNRTAAQEFLLQVLEFNPDSPYAWKLWSPLSKKESQCSGHKSAPAPTLFLFTHDGFERDLQFRARRHDSAQTRDGPTLQRRVNQPIHSQH